MKFFSQIPDHLWCSGSFGYPDRAQCALGHMGVKPDMSGNPEAQELGWMLMHVLNLNSVFEDPDDTFAITESHAMIVMSLNDGAIGQTFGNHPKERILNALKKCLELATT